MLPILGVLAPIIGKVLGKTGDIIDQVVEDKDKAKQIKAELTLAGMQIDHSEFKTEIESATKIILAETNSQSWLARNWRPSLMWICILIIVNNYIFFPYLQLFTAKAVILDLPVWMTDIMKIGIGGYLGARTVEKGLTIWKDKQ